MPARRKEMDADARHVDAQQLRPEAAQQVLRFGMRRLFGLNVNVGLGQSFAVDFAVGRQRQFIQDHKVGRHHIVRQISHEPCLQDLRNTFNRRGQGDISYKTRIAVFIVKERRSFLDVRMLVKYCFNFAQFDAEAAQLDLPVDAPQEFEVAAGQPSCQVAGFVKSFRFAEQFDVDEFLGGQFGLVQIAARKARACNTQFARNAGRLGPVPGIQDKDARVGNGAANAEVAIRHNCR